jgi:hypothetical protein
MLQLLSGGAAVHWSAFRDDNLNGAWDDDEPALPGVSVGGDTSGVITGLGMGRRRWRWLRPPGMRPCTAARSPSG